MDWTEHYFGADYPRLYPSHLDAAASAREALASVRSLGLSPPARVLDLACGFGRHAVALAEAGYEVVGVDSSDPLLTMARRRAEDAGVARRCRFVLGDYREVRPPDLGGVFDGLLCLFHSLGYGEDADDERVLRTAFEALRPGGRMVLDLTNHARMMEADGRRHWTEYGGEDGRWFVLEHYVFDRHTRRLEGERVLVDPTEGRVARHPFRFRSYTPGEIRTRLKDVGFKVLAVHGTLDRAPFDASSPRMVLVCER